jgi:hypothetical protein
MSKKKIAIIGAGTAGVYAATHFNRWAKDCEIELYYDSNIKPQPVGEGSTLSLPRSLWNNLCFTYEDLYKIDGTVKTGIRKINWGGDGDFVHTFFPPNVSFHFNASSLQKYILNTLKDDIKIHDKNVTHDSIDADFIMDCSGKPKTYEEFNISEYISVNSVYVTQCYWDNPRFTYTLTIARPYGWVFGIPLQNRCSIGYMYNSNINTLEEVKEDVKAIFEQFNLTPSDTTNAFSFNNYYRKENFAADSRVVYNGNASFFLEPMEATSIGTMDLIQRTAYDLWFGDNTTVESANSRYLRFIKEVENMIMLHYCSGSKFDTPFWKFAQDRGERCAKEMMQNQKFVDMYNLSKRDWSFLISEMGQDGSHEYATWTPMSYNQNLNALNLYEKMDKYV